MSANLYSKGSSARIRTVGQIASHQSQLRDSYKPAGSEMIPNRYCAVQKSVAAKFFIATSFRKAIQVCVGEALLFWLLIWHFMNSGTSVKFDASHGALVSFACLGSHPRTGGRWCECWSCAGKVPKLAHLNPRSPQESQLWDSYQLAGSKMILNRYCAVPKSEAAQL